MLSEEKVLKQRVLRHAFPQAQVRTDAFDVNFSQPDEQYVHIPAGLPCQPFATHGERRAERDERSVTVSDAPARIAAHIGPRKIVFIDVEEHADFLTTGSKVLKRMHRELRQLELKIIVFPPELFSPHVFGGPIYRRRVALRGEPECVVARLGPPPPLRPIRQPSKTIADVWLPDAKIRPEQFVPGVLTMIPHVVDPRLPVVVATLRCGGDQPYFEGSVVKVKGDDCEYVIRAFESEKSVRLMRDVIGDVAYFPNVPIDSIVEHMLKTYEVLGSAGTARSFTKMSVPPLCHAKQLWLRNGRAYSPDWREMLALLELDESILDPLLNDPAVTDDQLAEIVGDMLSMRMAEAMADRSVTRAEQYETATRLDIAVASGDLTFEARVAKTFQPVAYTSPFSVSVVFVALSSNEEMIALVSRDRLQLPCASADAGSGSRASLVDTADRLVKLLNPGLEFAPHTFLIMQQSNLLAVACPLLGRYPQCRAFSYAKWSSLSDLAGSVAYTPVASAFARVAAYCRHGVPIPDVTVRDGARAAKRVLTLPWTPSAVPAAWPLQLQYLTAVDTLFRRRLAATPKTHPHYAYLVEWIDQVDTSLNASIPFCLRGMSQVEFGNKRLLNAPFVSSVVVNKTDPPTFPKTPSTSFKPTSVRQILTDESILKIVKFLRHLVLAMQYIKAGKKIPSSLRAKLKTLVIPQSGFHPLAQGITWDLRQRHPDGHFMPLDVERPIDSHLHTKALFDALGESYPDQSLRYQILKGALFFANDDAMQIVICPHLLSIADGFPLMEKTFIRREKLGYLTFTSTEHEIEIGQEMVILALGIVPVRVTAQGSRARKLTPLNPRGIADAGGPHDFGPDADGVPVKSLNDLIGWRSEVDGKPKFNRENKPTMQQLMNNISVLKFAGRIFNEPLLLFNDDSADAFNQFHLHRSQIRMTSILWLKITEVVSKCEYTHIIEPTFGFGFSNASDFCQRFNDGLQHLVETEMAALEEIEWAKVTDPSQRAWMSARDQLTVKTGTQQRKLYFMLVFTDDPLFAAVGFDRCIRLICCWRNVIVLAGLRMAIAAKRQAGSNVLWIGFRTYGTFGAVVIPDEKRMRAIRQLRASADGALVTVEDAKSVAGLLEHLCPFAAQLRSSMYQMYEPHKMYWSKPNTYAFVPSEQYRIVCSRWVDRLVECSGVSCLVVILSRRPDSVGSHLYVMSSDAAKDGTDTPGVGGYMHGRAWCIQLERSDVVGPFQISINALEFLGIYGNFVHFGPEIPTANARLLQLADSLTSTIVGTEFSAKAESMQHVHTRLLEEPNYQRLSNITELAHFFGPANIFSDAISRGYHLLVSELSAQLRIEIEWIPTDLKVLTVLQELRHLARRNALLAEAKESQRVLSADAQSLGKRVRGNTMGDGPRDSRTHGAPSFVPRAESFISPPTRPSSVADAVGYRPISDPPALHRAPMPMSPKVVRPAVTRAQPSPDALRVSPAQPSHMPAPQFARRAPPPKLFSFLSPDDGTDPPPAGFSFVNVKREREKPSPPRRTVKQNLAVRGAPSFVANASREAARAPPDVPGAQRRRPQSAAPLNEHSESVFEVLSADKSKYALCPGDPGLLRSLISDVQATIMRGVPKSTAKKDRRYWRLWAQHCRFLGTTEWRDDMWANSGHDAVGAQRERLLQSTFVLRVYRNMKPRNRAHKAAKPQSARGPLDAVRRIHKRNDIRMCDAPSVTLLLRGLLDDYVRLHGTETLIPQRREPLTNEHTERLLSPANEGMKVGRRTINWRQPFWISFAAFLTTLRHSGSRKADLLDVVVSDFCLSSMTRRNLKWHINGRLVDVVTPAMLAALTRADCAVIIPGRTKADPFSLFFGDKPIYLPFEQSDITNAAMWLRTLELDRPVPAEARARVPLFASDDVCVPLTHYEADAVFNSMAKDLLGADAKSLSLHSGRVWLACALLASGHDTSQIQAMVRWLSPEAVKIYAHTNPEDYVRNLRRAMGAPITSRLATNVADMELDGDRSVQAVRAAIGGSVAAPSAVPRAGTARLRATSAPPPSTELSDDDDSAAEPEDDDDGDDDDPSVLCDAGPVVADVALTPGAEVAVPFQFKGRGVHYVATLGGRKQNGNYLVRFPDGLTMEARRDSLFKVIPFDEQV